MLHVAMPRAGINRGNNGFRNAHNSKMMNLYLESAHIHTYMMNRQQSVMENKKPSNLIIYYAWRSNQVMLAGRRAPR